MSPTSGCCLVLWHPHNPPLKTFRKQVRLDARQTRELPHDAGGGGSVAAVFLDPDRRMYTTMVDGVEDGASRVPE